MSLIFVCSSVDSVRPLHFVHFNNCFSQRTFFDDCQKCGVGNNRHSEQYSIATGEVTVPPAPVRPGHGNYRNPMRKIGGRVGIPDYLGQASW